MSEFDFATDEKSYHFCRRIAEEMATGYQIPIEDAVARINWLWSGHTFQGEDSRYHWLDWATHIFRFYEEHHPIPSEER
jgi:hypothetical protein